MSKVIGKVLSATEVYFDATYFPDGRITPTSHTQNTDTGLGTLGTKNPPIDADKVIYRNSASSDTLVTSTWTQIKAFLKTYFDGLYATIASLADYLPLGGGTMTGNILTNAINIEGVATTYGNQQTIFINSADTDPFSITMPDPTTMFGVRLTVYIVALGDGSCTLDFSDKLNNADANPVLTSADIGKSIMVISNGTAWYNHKFDLI